MTNLFSSLVFRGKEAVLETENLLRKYSDSSGNQSPQINPNQGRNSAVHAFTDGSAVKILKYF